MPSDPIPANAVENPLTQNQPRKRVLRVLVYPGGTEVGLEINDALRGCKDVVLFSAGLAVPNHAAFVFARHFELPNIADPDWLDALNGLLARLGIDYIFPAYDDVLVALAQNASRIKARIASSPVETCLITRSKSETYRRLDGSLNVPRVYESAPQIESYPVFVKPDRGQGSQHTHLVRDNDQLAVVLRQVPGAIILEYLPGREYTIDCFSDRDKGLLFCGGRERIRTRNGISVSTRPVAEDFRKYALAISARLQLWGAWFFQMKEDATGDPKLLEVAPRIAGAMALHRAIGVNFPLLTLYEQERIPVLIHPNRMEIALDRALVNRYCHNLTYRTVYVDLDDTLIFNGKVNSKLVSFLFQCINEGKKIVLLTRHAEDLNDVLRMHRLLGIFDRVQSVPPKPDHKSQWIQEKDAILIDDSFSERMAVANDAGIPTFDCSMIEVLMNDRV